jgi:diguanylate cyclase (GGDEF)-like protein
MIKPLARYPLIFGFILVALLTTLVIFFFTYQTLFKERVGDLKRGQAERVHQRMVELQGTINDFNRRHDFNAVQREVSRLNTDPTVELIAILDEHGRVMSSNVIEYRNRMLQSLPELQEIIDSVPEKNRAGFYEISPLVRLTGVYELGDVSHRNPDQRFSSMLLVRFNITQNVNDLLYQQREEAIEIALMYLGLSFVGFLLLYLGLYGQIRAILRATARFASGDLQSRVKLDSNNEFATIADAFNDMAGKLQAQTESLRELAERDSLTRLHSRASFVEAMQQHINDKGDVPFALLFMDLDGFKSINDTLGHYYGDELLKAVSQRIVHHVKEGDIVGRFGGDEFLVMLNNQHDREIIHAIVDRVRESVAKPVLVEGKSLYTSASVGIARYPIDAESVGELIRRADIAMYQAKESGKNDIRFFARDAEQQSLEQHRLDSLVRAALQHGRVMPVFQPQYDSRQKQVVGFEALARLIDDNGQLLSPEKFIPVISRKGWMNEFSILMFRKSLSLYAGWVESVKPFPVPLLALNFPSSHFSDSGLLDDLDQLFLETGFNPRWLEVKITENIFMENIEQKLDVLQVMHKKGMRIAIGDFGTGFSSMLYLKKLPISKIKIDREFIRDIEIDSDDNLIIETILMMGHKLGLQVIAEGVETLEQFQFLERRQCRLFQGYLIGMPAALPKGLPEVNLPEFKTDNDERVTEISSVDHRRKS